MCIPDNVRIIIPCPVKDSCSFLDTASSVCFINPSLSSRAKVSTDGKAQGYERREEFVRRGDVRACVNTQAEMEGREEIGGRAHECVSLSSVHTLCHCGALPLTLSPVVSSRLKSARFRRVRFRNRAPSPKRDATRGGRRGRIVTPLCARNRAAKIDERGWRSEAESFGRESIITTRGLFASAEAAPSPVFLDNGSKERQIRPGKHKYFGEYNGEVYK